MTVVRCFSRSPLIAQWLDQCEKASKKFKKSLEEIEASKKAEAAKAATKLPGRKGTKVVCDQTR